VIISLFTSGNAIAAMHICDHILESLPFGILVNLMVIIHISQEQKAFGVKLLSKKVK